MKLFLKSKIKEIVLFIAVIGLFLLAFLLYRLPMEAVIYPFVLCIVVFLVYMVISYISENKRKKLLSYISNYEDITATDIGEYKTVCEKEYRRIIKMLSEENSEMLARENAKYNEIIDYYTLWVHQIKTPIAAMNLTLQSEDSRENRQLARELLKIEQYVQMVLTYLRLDSPSSDYLLREYELDSIIKESVRKFSPEFISKKIGVEIIPTEYSLITDEKWFCFLLEQILSNALKYSEHGRIKIYMENQRLCICDEGIGIAKEDLPRIFERGYTGYNGRNHKKASGIGLYLCKRICDNMNIKISVTSQLGIGTTVSLDLGQYKITE